MNARSGGPTPLFGPDWLATRQRPESVIVCGSAPSLLEEFAVAMDHEANSEIICVNDAAALVAGHHLHTQHPERAAGFKARSVNPDICVHAGKPRERASLAGIDVYWPDALRNATSGGSAVWLALMLGARRVVLCGLPLDGGTGYHPAVQLHRDEPRVGLEPATSEYVQRYQRALAEWADSLGERRLSIRSLGGFTRRLFGAPDWLHETTR